MQDVFDKKIFLNEGDLVEKMEESEQLDFLGNCSQIFKNPVIKKIYDDLVCKQIIYAARKSGTMEELAFNRGTINGVDLFFDELKRFAGIYEEKTSSEEFDKFKVLSEE